MYFAYAGRPLSQEDLGNLTQFQDILIRARDLSAQHGAKLVLVYVPTKFRVCDALCVFPPDGYGREWRASDLPDRLAGWAAGQGIADLDLTPALKESAAAGDLVFFTGDGHWNGKGNEVAAEVLVRFIEHNGWLR